MTYQHRTLPACVWQDTKPVVIVIIATNSNPTTPTTVECKQRDGSKSTDMGRAAKGKNQPSRYQHMNTVQCLST